MRRVLFGLMKHFLIDLSNFRKGMDVYKFLFEKLPHISKRGTRYGSIENNCYITSRGFWLFSITNFAYSIMSLECDTILA